MARREAEPDRDREEEELSGEPRRYASNTLALLAARGNPHHVTGLGDLARPGLRVALPNPETESIGSPPCGYSPRPGQLHPARFYHQHP
jgi:hypothetical protein